MIWPATAGHRCTEPPLSPVAHRCTARARSRLPCSQQASLAPHVVLHDDADWLVSSSEGGDWQARLHMVGGLDISVFPSVDASGGSGNGGGVASLAVLAFPSLALRHLEQLHLPSLTAPYIPGFLGFRYRAGAGRVCGDRRRCVAVGAAHCPPALHRHLVTPVDPPPLRPPCSLSLPPLQRGACLSRAAASCGAAGRAPSGRQHWHGALERHAAG